jgi:hypothetical protein
MTRTVKWFLIWSVFLFLVSAAILLALLSSNRAPPTKHEYDAAHELVAMATHHLAADRGESVFFEVSRGAVAINVYGITDVRKQELLASALRSGTERERFPAVNLNFFSALEVESTTTEAGVKISNVKRGRLLREIRIHSGEKMQALK